MIDWTLIATTKEVSSYYHQVGITLEQAAEHFGVGKSTFIRFIKSNGISSKPRGRQITLMNQVRAVSSEQLDKMTLHELALEIGTNVKTANTYRWLIRQERSNTYRIYSEQ